MTKRKYRTDEEWLSLIQECRLSGLTDKQWCETHQICPSNFITRFRNSAREPVKYRSLIQKQLWLHKNRKLFKLHLNSRLYRNILSPVYQRTQRQMQQFLCRSMAFRSESQMQRPKVQSFILCQRCIACVRWSVRCIEDLPDHRQDRYEKKLRWLNGDYSW